MTASGTHTDDPVTVALVGYGHAAQAHVDALHRMPDVRIVGVCEISQDKAEQAGLTLGVPGYFDLEGMLDKVRPDAVVVCTSTEDHVDSGLRSLARLCHVFIETPPTQRLAEATILEERAGGAERVVMYGYHGPVMLGDVRRHVEALGKIHRVSAHWLRSPVAAPLSDVIRQPAALDPPLLDLSHPLGTAMWLTNLWELSSVASRLTRHGSPCDPEQHDAVEALIGFGDTVLHLRVATWGHFGSDEQVGMVVEGAKGTLVIPYPTVRTSEAQPVLLRHGSRTPVEAVVLSERRARARQMATFIDVVRGQTSPPIDHVRGRQIMAVLEAVQLAAQ